MKGNVRLIDIARKANVSLGTVDRVVNGRGNVAPETEARVREILKDLDYRPNLLASSLASKKRLRIAVLLPKPYGEDYWHQILEGIEKEEAEISRFGVEVSDFLYEQYDDLQYKAFSRKILDQGYDGVLTAPVFEGETRKFATQLDDHGVPYVFIDAGISGTRPLCSVSQDVFQSGRLGARLLDFGLGTDDEILMVSIRLHAENAEHSLLRAGGFRDYFRSGNHPGKIIHPLEIVNPRYEMLSASLDGIFSGHPRIRGIFINNSKAFMIARYLKEHALSGVKLVGFDLIEQNILALRAGTIDFLIYDQSESQGEIGLNILFDYLARRKPSPSRVKMPVHIATRENLDGILPGQD